MGGTGALLSSIRDGVPLGKKAPAPAPSGGRGSLLSSIKGGVALKKTDVSKAAARVSIDRELVWKSLMIVWFHYRRRKVKYLCIKLSVREVVRPLHQRILIISTAVMTFTTHIMNGRQVSVLVTPYWKVL